MCCFAYFCSGRRRPADDRRLHRGHGQNNLGDTGPDAHAHAPKRGQPEVPRAQWPAARVRAQRGREETDAVRRRTGQVPGTWGRARMPARARPKFAPCTSVAERPAGRPTKAQPLRLRLALGNRLPRSLLPPPPLGTRMSHWGRWNRDTGSADPRASPSRHTSARALRHLRRRSACCTSILATGGSATCSSPRIPATARSAEDRTLATVSSAGADALVFLSWCPASFWPSRCSWTCGTRLCPAQSRGSARQRAARRTREALPARESSCSFQDRKPGLRVPARARLRSCPPPCEQPPG